MKDTRNVYLFIGPPGSGKGSLAQYCVQELGWKQLSTGNLCRKHIREQTEIGKEIDFAIKSGKLISDELVTAMVCEWLNQEIYDAPAVILDGYPRTLEQAQALNNTVQSLYDAWELQVIKLVVEDDIVVDRLCRRYICQNKECQAVYSLNGGELVLNNGKNCTLCASPLGRRNDDEPLTVRERLIVYHKGEDSILQFYRDKGKMVQELNVEKPLYDVFRDFIQLIGLNSR